MITIRTYLVTGAAGFIGSNFVHYMLKKYDKDIRIIAVDCLTYAGNLNNLQSAQNHTAFQFQEMNICDYTKIKVLFQENDIDYVVNFAAESHVDRSIIDPGIFIRTNVLGTQILLDAAKRTWMKNGNAEECRKKFLQISTDEVYGSLGPKGFFTEETPLDPHSPYSASKAAADLLVKAYGDTYQFPFNISRCSNNYGPYQFPEKLIPLGITKLLHGEKIPVYGDGKNIRDWLYVEDHCRAIDMILHHGKRGKIYNIGGNNEKENIEIICLIQSTLSQLVKNVEYEYIEFVEDRKGHDRRYAIDASKIYAELGWAPEISFETGIRKTIQWYVSHQDWITGILNRRE